MDDGELHLQMDDFVGSCKHPKTQDDFDQGLFLPQTAGQTGPVMRVSMPYSAKVKFVTCTSAGAAPLKSMQSCPELTYANALPVPAMNSVRQSAYEEALDGQQEPVQDMTKEFVKTLEELEWIARTDFEADLTETVQLLLHKLLMHEEIRYAIAVSIDQFLISSSVLHPHLDAARNGQSTNRVLNQSLDDHKNNMQTEDEHSNFEICANASDKQMYNSDSVLLRSVPNTGTNNAEEHSWRYVRKSTRDRELGLPSQEISKQSNQSGSLDKDAERKNNKESESSAKGIIVRGLDMQYLSIKFKRQRFNKAREELLLDKIAHYAARTKSSDGSGEVRDLIREMVIDIMRQWKIEPSLCTKFIKETVTKKYESFVSRKASALGDIGKKMLPFWGATIMALGITLYCALKDTYIQIVDNYFRWRQPLLSRLLNPSYYGRLGETCFSSLITSARRNYEEKKNFLRFILEWEFGKFRLGVDGAKEIKGKRWRRINREGCEEKGEIMIGINSREDDDTDEEEEDDTEPQNKGMERRSEKTGAKEWSSDDIVSHWMSTFKSKKNLCNANKYFSVKDDVPVTPGRENVIKPSAVNDLRNSRDAGDEKSAVKSKREKTKFLGDISNLGEDDKMSRLFALADKIRQHRRKKPWALYLQEVTQREDSCTAITKSQYLTEIIRQHGILPELRGKFWQGLSGANNNKNLFSYQSILLNCTRRTKHTEQIEKDLQRTFPGNENFQSGEGIAALRRTLTAYSWVNTDVGYCQSMNFICALLLLYMEEEDAFWMLMTIIEDILPPDFYNMSMQGIIVYTQIFMELLHRKLPKIGSHLQALEVDILPILHHWFLCLFVTVLPLEVVVHVWDCLFNEGPHVLFRVALALLKLNEPLIIMTNDNADTFLLIKELPQHVDKRELMELAFAKSFMRGIKKEKNRLEYLFREQTRSGSAEPKRGSKMMKNKESSRTFIDRARHSRSHSESTKHSHTSDVPLKNKGALKALSSRDLSTNRGKLHTSPNAIGENQSSEQMKPNNLEPFRTNNYESPASDSCVFLPSERPSSLTPLSTAPAEGNSIPDPPSVPPKLWSRGSKSRIVSRKVDPKTYQALREKWQNEIKKKGKDEDPAIGEQDKETTEEQQEQTTEELPAVEVTPEEEEISSQIQRRRSKREESWEEKDFRLKLLMEMRDGSGSEVKGLQDNAKEREKNQRQSVSERDLKIEERRNKLKRLSEMRKERMTEAEKEGKTTKEEEEEEEEAVDEDRERRLRWLADVKKREGEKAQRRGNSAKVASRGQRELNDKKRSSVPLPQGYKERENNQQSREDIFHRRHHRPHRPILGSDVQNHFSVPHNGPNERTKRDRECSFIEELDPQYAKDRLRLSLLLSSQSVSVEVERARSSLEADRRVSRSDIATTHVVMSGATATAAGDMHVVHSSAALGNTISSQGSE